MEAVDHPATYLVIGLDGAVYGPADVAGLQAWAREGRVMPDTWLKEQATGRQSRAAELTELSAFWPAPALLPPPPALPAPALPRPIPTVVAGICGNCRRPVAPGVRFCPSCGFGGGTGLSELPPQLLTGSALWDTALGLTGTLALVAGPSFWILALSGAGALSGPLFWLVFSALFGAVARRFVPYPRVRRGIGIGLALSLIALPFLAYLGVVSALTTFFSMPFRPCKYP